MSEVIQLQNVIQDKKVNDAINEQAEKKLKMYAGDYRRFEKYCQEHNRPINFSSLELYLLDTIERGLKLTTFNKRASSIKYYLIHLYNEEETEEQRKRIALLRERYNKVEYSEQKLIKGQSAKNKKEVMELINKLDTRKKAISLLNLITASRPSEMITIKVKHIDLDNHSVSIYMKKQKEWKVKRITLECAKALKEYIKQYKLQDDDYIVCRTDKHGNVYGNQSISDVAYRKAIHKWLGFAPYSLRKTQISSMHENGADLATIAKQSGHKNLETITKHYLEVNDTTIDKFL